MPVLWQVQNLCQVTVNAAPAYHNNASLGGCDLLCVVYIDHLHVTYYLDAFDKLCRCSSVKCCCCSGARLKLPVNAVIWSENQCAFSATKTFQMVSFMYSSSLSSAEYNDDPVLPATVQKCLMATVSVKALMMLLDSFMIQILLIWRA